jgi:membrane protein DedA with SNARE-associated domain
MLPLALFFQMHQIHHWVEAGGYGALFGLLLSCGLGMPLPEDVPLIAAGILIHQGRMHVLLAAPLAWLGIMGGDCILYFLGYRFGEAIVNVPVIGRHVTLTRLRRAENLFRKYGVVMVGVGRLFMGIRGAMVVTAGTSRFKFVKFIIADGLAAIVSGGLFMWLGYWVGAFGPEMKDKADEFRRYLYVAAAVVGIGLLTFFIWKDRRQKVAPEEAETKVEPAKRE